MFMAVFFAVGAWLQTSGRGFTSLGLTLSCAAVWHMSWGILYVIAAVKIVRPQPFWEKAIVVSSVAQIAIMAACSVLVSWQLMQRPTPPSPPIDLFLIMGYAAIYIFSFLRLAQLAAKLRNEGQAGGNTV
jgi:hypothetical protein